MKKTKTVIFASLVGAIAAVGLTTVSSKRAAAIEPITIALLLGAGYAVLHTATGIGPGPARDGVVFGRRVNRRADFGPRQFGSRQFGSQQFGSRQFGSQQFGAMVPHIHDDPRLGLTAPHSHFSQQFGQLAPHMHSGQQFSPMHSQQQFAPNASNGGFNQGFRQGRF